MGTSHCWFANSSPLPLMSYEQLKLDNQLCFRLYAASRLIIQAYHPYLEPLGLTYPKYLALMVLWEKDERPVNHIARQMALETNTVTPLIQRMEREGLVTRRKGTEDTRQTIVSLTERGKALQEAASNVPNCMLDMLCKSGLNPDSVMEIVPQLDEIISHLRK